MNQVIDFELPENLLTAHPTKQRDRCKMLVFDRATQKISHTFFSELPSLLNPDYFLVLNQARVDPSRIFWTDLKGKKQEILFLRYVSDDTNGSIWEAIVSGKDLKVNHSYSIDSDFSFSLLETRENSIARVKTNKTRKQIEALHKEKGQLPLPPYILKKRKKEGQEDYTQQDEINYQTVFCKDGGATAAPTAGLHFTKETFSDLKSKKIGWDFVHLSVGWGTFAPLTQKNFDTKKLHPEFCEVANETAKNILDARKSKKKILAVGTTSVRTLESWAREGLSGEGFKKDTDLFILPPYRFQIIDALLTNFHLPKSSLLLMVAAFLGENGEKTILNLYNEAISERYRFYSYGDCMLIL